MEEFDKLYERIITSLREGKTFSFTLEYQLRNKLSADFFYDTTRRVNNYHQLLKSFHLEKYGRELRDGGEFGGMGDRTSHIIGMEYLFFCASGGKMREFKIDNYTKIVTVFQK